MVIFHSYVSLPEGIAGDGAHFAQLAPCSSPHMEDIQVTATWADDLSVRDFKLRFTRKKGKIWMNHGVYNMYIYIYDLCICSCVHFNMF